MTTRGLRRRRCPACSPPGGPLIGRLRRRWTPCCSALARGPPDRTERRSLAKGRRWPWALPVVIDMLLAGPERSAARQTADLHVDLLTSAVVCHQSSSSDGLRRPGPAGTTRTPPSPESGRHMVVDVWLADDVQLGEDVAADPAASVPSARGHPVVAAGGADPKGPAGRRRTILGRRGFRWEAVVAGPGRA